MEKQISNITDVFQCVEKKCAALKKKLEAVNLKYKDERMKLLKSNMSDKTFMQKLLGIQKKINKTEEKLKHTECQLNKCYDKTHKMVMDSIDLLLQKVNKKSEPKKYQIIMKYKKIFAQKIEVKDLIKFHEISFLY